MKNKTLVLKVFLSLIFPLYSLPWTLKGMIKNEKWAFFIFSFLMGLVGILYPPVGDFHQYTMKSFVYNSMTWSSFLTMTTYNLDFLLYITGYVLNQINIPFDFTRFLYNFIAHLLLCYIYYDLRKHNEVLNVRSNAIKSLLVFVGFSLVSNLFRFGFSTQLFMCGSYLISFRNKTKGWLFVTLAVLNHFSFILFASALLVFKIFKITFSRNFIIIIGLSAMILSGDIFMGIFQQLPLPSNIIEHYSYYLDGYYASEWKEELTWREQIADLITSCIKYIFIGVYILLYSKKNKNDTALVNALMLLSFVTLPFTVINSRFMGVMVYSIKMFYFKNFYHSKLYKNSLNLLVVLCLMSQLMGVWSCRRQLSLARESQLLYKPSFVILTNTYTPQWIRYNVDSEGGLIQVKY